MSTDQQRDKMRKLQVGAIGALIAFVVAILITPTVSKITAGFLDFFSQILGVQIGTWFVSLLAIAIIFLILSALGIYIAHVSREIELRPEMRMTLNQYTLAIFALMLGVSICSFFTPWPWFLSNVQDAAKATIVARELNATNATATKAVETRVALEKQNIQLSTKAASMENANATLVAENVILKSRGVAASIPLETRVVRLQSCDDSFDIGNLRAEKAVGQGGNPVTFQVEMYVRYHQLWQFEYSKDEKGEEWVSYQKLFGQGKYIEKFLVTRERFRLRLIGYDTSGNSMPNLTCEWVVELTPAPPG